MGEPTEGEKRAHSERLSVAYRRMAERNSPAQASHDVSAQRTEVTCGLRRKLSYFFSCCDFVWMVRLLVGPSIFCWRCTPAIPPVFSKTIFLSDSLCERINVKSQQCTLGAVRCTSPVPASIARPVSSHVVGRLAQLARASPLQGEGRGFESLNAHK